MEVRTWNGSWSDTDDTVVAVVNRRKAGLACGLLAGLLSAVACHPDTGPMAPPADSSVSADASAMDGTDMTVQVSPRAVMVFSRVGETARTITFSAQLLDSDGTPQAPPPPGTQWAVAEQGGLRLGETGVSSDSLTASAEVHANRPGRDTLFARAGSHSGQGVTTNWEWVSGSWSGPNWIVPGQSGCLELAGRDSGANAVSFPDFDYIFQRSFDPEVVTVDSLVFASDGISAQLCVTGRSTGQGRVGVMAWDTTAFEYLGEYTRFHVLQPPLTVSMEASEWELGVGQSHPLSLVLTDDLGYSLPVDPEWIDSWQVSDSSLLAIEDAVLTAKTSGSGEFRVTYLGQEMVAHVEVYAIVEGRFNQDVMCVRTERGTVRCWGDQWRPLWGYGQRTRGFVGPLEVGDMPLGGHALQFYLGHYSECVRTLAGDVRCWGSARGGKLGYGNLNHIGDDETLADVGPVPIGISGRVVDIGGGDDFVCAVFDSGRVRCWGGNHAGQLGMGHQDQINVGDDETPAEMNSDVLLGGRAVQVAGGRYKACALLDTGKVRCWGLNADDWDWENKEVVGRSYGLGYGEFGTIEPIGDDEPPSEAGDLELPGTAKKIVVGGYYMCALMDDGAVRCWGFGGHGNLGHGQGGDAIGDDETTAATIPLYFESPVVDIAAAYWHTCVLLENGSVRCWGDGYSSGQLGLPGRTRLGLHEHVTSVPPVRVGGPVARIFLYEDGTCAVMRAGGLRCWGYNGGILGYPFLENIGDDEHPESVGDIKLFPGPVTRGSLSASVAAYSDPVDHLAGSVVVLPAGSLDSDRPWRGPLAGPGEVMLPDSVAGTAANR